MVLFWITLVLVVLVGGNVVEGANVTYDGRSLLIDGERKILFSGSIHYPRSTPDMWPSLIAKAKQGGLDVIQTYVFWNLHEPQPDQYDFSGRNDIVSFIKQVQQQGLYVSLRIGPFIEAEWGYRGLPFWLHDVPGIVFRTYNEPFKLHMQNFTTTIVNMMKAEKLFASQGGPIILSQIENEYQNVEGAFHEDGPRYVNWSAQMAVGQNTGEPWMMMCKQQTAPDPVINTCNGMRCDETWEGPNSPNKPSLWTENWTSFVQGYGEGPNMRTAQDIAFHTTAFIITRNGSFVNYYMYHGGTNFGRAPAAFIITGYYDQAPLDEYAIEREPKYSHLQNMHAALKQCSQALLYGQLSIVPLGQNQTAYVYNGNSGECAAFLFNNGSREAQVLYQNLPYTLPSKSISILPDCKTVVFNTATVSKAPSTRSMVPVISFNSPQEWETYSEYIPQYDDTSLRSDTLLDQMNTTKDTSDYLWYTMRFQQNSSEAQSTLNVTSLGHVLRAYINGALVGSAHGARTGPTFTFENTTSLPTGINNISFLNVMVGLPDSGAHMERRRAGLSQVIIQQQNFTSYSWGYQVGLVGEKLSIYTDEGSSNVTWSQYENPRTLTWYKTIFDTPEGNESIALNLGSMGKGEAWINGQSIGRYWVTFMTAKGTPSQTWYNVPRSFLRPNGNLLVLFEEEYGNPLNISLDTVSNNKVCGHVSDIQPHRVNSWEVRDHYQWRPIPRVYLQCPPKRVITKIVFASHGNPSGNCDSYALGSCHSSSTQQIVEKACLGKSQCSIAHTTEIFGGDPCPGTLKTLLVDARCE